MSLKFIIGEIGSGKTYAAAKEIKVLSEKNKPVTLIVPEQYSSEAEHKLYGFLGISLFNNVKVETFTRIKDKIFCSSVYNKGELPDEAAKTAVMYAVKKELSKEDMPFFKNRINSSSFTLSALKIVRELEMNGIEPSSLLSDKIEDNILSGKIRDIVTLCERYNEKLIECGYTNALSDGMKAAEIAEETGFFKGEYIFIDEFKSFTADELRLIDAMISQGNLTVCMPTPYKAPVYSPVFSSVNETVSRINKDGYAEFITADSKNDRFEKAPDIRYIGRNILRAGKTEKIISENIITASSSDMQSECDYICAEISRLVRTGKYKYKDFAVLSRDFESYRAILETDLIRYEIPYFMDMTSSAGNEPLIIFTQSLLEAANADKISTETFLKLLKTGFTDTDEADISEIEKYYIKHGIKKIKLSEITSVHKESESIPNEDILYKINVIQNKVLFPVLSFSEAVSGSHTLREFTEEFCKLLNSFDLAEVSVRGFSEESKEGRDAYRIKKILGKTLVGISEIHLAGGADNFTLKEYRELFGSIISEEKISAPAHALNGVTAASSDRARLSSPKVVFIMGANEGFFPFKVSGSGIFTERELETLENTLGLRFNERIGRMAAEENFIAVSSVSAPSEKLYITYSLSDISGKSKYPSDLCEYIEKICDIKAVDISEKSADFFITNENTARYQYVKNLHKEKSLEGRKLSAAVKAYGEDFKLFAQRSYGICERIRSERILDVKISEENAERIFLSNEKYLGISPTGLETYAKCPFMFFCKNGLKLKLTKPHEFISSVRGNVIHNALSEILEEILKASEEKKLTFHEYFSSLSDEDISSLVEKNINDYYEKTFKSAGYESSPSFDKAYFREKDEINEIILHLRDEFSPENSKFVPSGFEVVMGKTSVGEKNKISAWKVDFTSENGKKHTALINGKVDRIDVFEESCGDFPKRYVRVIDYKSGGKKFKFSDIVDGINMQMLIYLIGITDKNSGFSDYREDIPAGVMYYPSKAAQAKRNATGNRLYPDVPETLREIINSSMTMDGFALADVNSIRAMENKAEGVFIPQKLNTGKVGSYIDSLAENYKNTTDEGAALFDICKCFAEKKDHIAFSYELLMLLRSDSKDISRRLSEKFGISEIEKLSDRIKLFSEKFDLSSDEKSRDIFLMTINAVKNFDRQAKNNEEEKLRKNINKMFLSPDGKTLFPSKDNSLTDKEWENIRDFVSDKIRSVCRELSSGYVHCKPLFGEHPCDYCDFKAVCENRGQTPSSFRYEDKNAEAVIKNIREKE